MESEEPFEGGILRRHVARTVTQQIVVTHTLQTITDLDERATILSVDEVGTCDLVSRSSMRLENGGGVAIRETPTSLTETGATHHLLQREVVCKATPLHLPLSRRLAFRPLLGVLFDFKSEPREKSHF